MLFLLTHVAVAAEPLYFRVFSHYENIVDVEEGVDDIRAQTDALRSLGLVAEHNVHRGEHQAAWWADHAPDVIDRLREPSVSLAYHPHPMRPFTDTIIGMSNLPWDQAVAAFTEFESCAVDFGTGAVDCKRPGGAVAARQIIGKPFDSVCDGGPWAVATYVWTKVFGIPTQLDTGVPQLDGLFGDGTYAYWYMGQLVLKHPNVAQVTVWDQRTTGDVLAQLPGDGPKIVTLLGSDKLHFPEGNEYASERWTAGASVAQLRPTPDLLTPPGKRLVWLEKFKSFAKAFAKEATRTGGAVVTGRTLLDRVAPVSERLTRAELDRAAAAWVAATTDRPPLGVDVDGRVLSSADVYDGLARALVAYRDRGEPPASVDVPGTLLGPIGDQTGARAVGAARGPVTGKALLAAIPAKTDRVPYQLTVADAGSDPILATEAVWLMAKLYASIAAGSGVPATIDRPTVSLRLEPLGAPPLRLARKGGGEGRPAAGAPPRGGARPTTGATSRWDWYTELQWWTAKPARWR
jgi:hypothetical protein